MVTFKHTYTYTYIYVCFLFTSLILIVFVFIFLQELMLVPPPWLEQLLSTTFFTMCKTHINTPRNECNMYCLDCKDQSFCFYCKQSWHKDHQVIQVGTVFYFLFFIIV